jgi:hypothetical protein
LTVLVGIGAALYLQIASVSPADLGSNGPRWAGKRGDQVRGRLLPRPGWSREQSRRYFRETHGPLAMAIPGVRGYVQNFVEADERRSSITSAASPRISTGASIRGGASVTGTVSACDWDLPTKAARISWCDKHRIARLTVECEHP